PKYSSPEKVPQDISIYDLGFEIPDIPRDMSTTRTVTPKYSSPEKVPQDISIYDLGFEIPDIPLGKINFKAPNLHATEAKIKRRPLKTNATLKKIGNGALALSVFAGSFAAGNLLLSERVSTEKTPAKEAESHIPAATHNAEVEQNLSYLDIKPRADFMTPEGNLASPDYIFRASTIGSTIYGYMRPAEEAKFIGEDLGSTPIDVVVPAIEPQIMTEQLRRYADEHPEFTPTLERTSTRGKSASYWNGKTAGEFQKTAMQEYGYSVPPGQIGNSVQLMHASTRSVGGGDLPALNIGDTIFAETLIDGNNFAYRLAEIEVLKVDEDGNLTLDEQTKQVSKGYRQGVTAAEVVYTYIGHEDQATLTIQICGDENGTPGGYGGDSAKDTRVIYRFILDFNQSEIQKMYANTPTSQYVGNFMHTT
ncbi:hypothetical protein KC974_02475, partial [Candidatus Saccharibacteria bacterium]|nr:hypothetical protein [Candidatus Saccharibacteria bacterium]